MTSPPHDADLGSALAAWLRGHTDLAASEATAVVALVNLLVSEPEDATHGELADHAVAAYSVASVVSGATAPWLAAWEASQLWAIDGARSAPAWLQTHALVSRTRAAGHLRSARTLRETPAVARAARSGALGEEKTRLLLGVRTPRTARAFAEQEAWLVDTVTGLTVEAARVFLEHWRNTADPDGPEPRDRSTSHLHISSAGTAGAARVDGHLATLDAATVLEAIDARIDAWHHAGLLAGDTRSRSELNAAALAEICGADAALPVRRRPTVLVHVGAGHLLPGASGGPAGGGVRGQAGTGGGSPLDPCDLPGRGPLHPRTAQRLACLGDLQRVITGTDGEILELGMAARLASPAQRKALIVRGHGHCEFPGCDAPHHWCEAHHVDPYRADPANPAEGTGPTDLSNLALLCIRHHRLVHEGGHRLIRGPDGWTARRPDGMPVTPTYRPDP